MSVSCDASTGWHMVFLQKVSHPFLWPVHTSCRIKRLFNHIGKKTLLSIVLRICCLCVFLMFLLGMYFFPNETAQWVIFSNLPSSTCVLYSRRSIVLAHCNAFPARCRNHSMQCNNAHHVVFSYAPQRIQWCIFVLHVEKAQVLCVVGLVPSALVCSTDCHQRVVYSLLPLAMRGHRWSWVWNARRASTSCCFWSLSFVSSKGFCGRKQNCDRSCTRALCKNTWCRNMHTHIIGAAPTGDHQAWVRWFCKGFCVSGKRACVFLFEKGLQHISAHGV